MRHVKLVCTTPDADPSPHKELRVFMREDPTGTFALVGTLRVTAREMATLFCIFEAGAKSYVGEISASAELHE